MKILWLEIRWKKDNLDVRPLSVEDEVIGGLIHLKPLWRGGGLFTPPQRGLNLINNKNETSGLFEKGAEDI